MIMGQRLAVVMLALLLAGMLSACDVGIPGFGKSGDNQAQPAAEQPAEGEGEGESEGEGEGEGNAEGSESTPTPTPATEEAATEPAPTREETTDTPNPTPTPTTRARVADMGGRTITVGSDPSYPPMEYLDPETATLNGFTIDMLNEIAALTNASIQFDTTRSYDMLIDALVAQELDMAASTLAITDERARMVTFSDPYLVSGQVVAVRQGNTTITSVQDLNPAQIIGVEQDTAGDIFISQLGFPETQIMRYQVLDNAFDGLAVDQVDAVVADGIPTARYTSHFDQQFQVAGQPFNKEYFALALPPGDTELTSAVNAAIAEMKASGTLQALIEKWNLANVAQVP